MWAKQAADALRVRERVIGQAWTRCPEELDLRHVDRCRYIGGSFKRVTQLSMFARDNLSSSERLVRKEGFEPPRPFGHKSLSLALTCFFPDNSHFSGNYALNYARCLHPTLFHEVFKALHGLAGAESGVVNVSL